MRRARARATLLLAAALVVACEATPTRPTPGVRPKGPTATASSGRPDMGAPDYLRFPLSGYPQALFAPFEDAPLGDAPADWVDVAREGQVPAWVYAGNWRVVEEADGNRVFLHDDVREQPAVSFQRYRGAALGTPDGQLPSRFAAEVAMRPVRSPHNYPPTGDQGVQFYYLDHARYVEIVVKPDQLEVWEADGAEPKTSKGWKRLWNQSLSTKGGDVRRIGTRVDVDAGTFEVWLDGAKLGSVMSALIKPQPAWLALRGIGNVVTFDDVRVDPLD